MTVSPPQAEPGAETGPLSLQQEFLCLFDSGDTSGPFGPRYLIVEGWRVAGRLDADILRTALGDVVARHEALRTVLVRDPDARGQRVLPSVPLPRVEVRDLPGVPREDRARRAEELVNEIDDTTLEIKDLPLMRAVIGRFDAEDSVLVLVTHHSAADAWSFQVIVTDLVECYAARAAGRAPALEPVAQYGEYTAAQLAEAGGPKVAKAREYWRTKLDGARIMVIPTDRAPEPGQDLRTTCHRYIAPASLREGTVELAARTRTSPFIVMLAAFNVMAAQWTGSTDIVVPTFLPGRRDGRFERTVGSFFNFVPLRTDLSGARDFLEVIARTRRTCLEAYAHEVPLLHVLQEAPELMNSAFAPGVAPCLFQVIQTPFVMEGHRAGELEYTAIWRRVIPQPTSADMPDGMLWSMHLGPSDDVVGAVGFSAHLFEQARVDEHVDRYVGLLARLLADPAAELPASSVPADAGLKG